MLSFTVPTGIGTVIGPTHLAVASGSGTAADPAVLAVGVTEGGSSALNVNAATVVKASAGRLYRISVTTAGVAGSVNDCATTGAVASSNQIAVIPAVVGVYTLDWPCASGIVISPGMGQVVSVSYS